MKRYEQWPILSPVICALKLQKVDLTLPIDSFNLNTNTFREYHSLKTRLVKNISRGLRFMRIWSLTVFTLTWTIIEREKELHVGSSLNRLKFVIF